MSAYIPVITKLSPIVIRILGCNPGMMTLQGTNTYLLGSGQKRILLDTGEPNIHEYIDHLKQVLSSEKATLEHIIISHWHLDHIGGVKDIFKSIAPSVWKYKRTDGEEPDIGDVPINELHDNQKFITEGATLKIVHTPGHTTDHVVLTLEEENALFSADCILGESTAVFEDLFTYIRSLQKILSFKPNVIYPGHGPVINNPVEKVKYYIEHRNKRESEILNVLNDGSEKTSWTEMELVKKIYKDTPEHLHVPASVNVNHHLKKLLKEGRVIEENDRWRIRSNL
ncbi:endoribonuclease LACTB2 isoform X2 [Planococcus citri]|uniref:endoribonuclease LACTB2 isoform X2 n=1 Tax=Planococcus citri TaxID=170843 RepID=UPI0031F99234